MAETEPLFPLRDEAKLIARYTVGMRLDGEQLALLKHYAARRDWTHSHAARYILGAFLAGYKRQLEGEGAWGVDVALAEQEDGEGYVETD